MNIVKRDIICFIPHIVDDDPLGQLKSFIVRDLPPIVPYDPSKSEKVPKSRVNKSEDPSKNGVISKKVTNSIKRRIRKN